MKLNTKAFAVTWALLWGLGVFMLTWWIILFEGSSRRIPALGRIYRGYTLTPRGSLIGLIWGFFDALAGGAAFGWLYNRLLRVMPAKKRSLWKNMTGR